MPGIQANSLLRGSLDVALDIIAPATQQALPPENVDQDAVFTAGTAISPARVDRTWAFNQATGARHDTALALDRAENPQLHSSGSIHRNYPSLNRLPGTIIVPPGRHYIYGTIILFAGQRLVGESSGAGTPGLPGSTLVKVGEGPCIKVLPPHDLDALLELDPESVLDVWAEGVAAAVRPDAKLRLAALGQTNAFVREGIGGVPPTERRLAVISQVAAAVGSAYIGGLRVEFERLPSGAERAADPDLDRRIQIAGLREPKGPRGDAHSALGVGEFFLSELRPGAQTRWVEYRRHSQDSVYSSGAIELVNLTFTRVEDVAISGFTNGFGILGYGNHAYSNIIGNTVERVRISGCHRGVILSRSTIPDENIPVLQPDGGTRLEPDQVDDGTLTVNGQFSINTSNTWTFNECEFSDCVVSGVECSAGTSRFVNCHFEHSARTLPIPRAGRLARPPSAGLVLAAGSPFVVGCTFTGAGPHVVCTQQSRGDGRSGVVEARTFSNAILLQNWFLNEKGAPALNPILAAEFPDGVGAADQRWHQPVYHPIHLPRGGHDSTRGPRGVVLDHARAGLANESTWSTENLLRGTFLDDVKFVRDAADANWVIEGAERGWQVVVDWSDEAAFVGPVFVIEGNRPLTDLLIVQRPVRPWSLAETWAAWGERNWTRGRRLVGATWAESSAVLAVSVGFRETSAVGNVGPSSVFGRANGRIEEWQLLSGFLDPRSVEYPLQANTDNDNVNSPHNLWGIDFVIRIDHERAKEGKFRIGAPQVTWGPDLLPVGPPKVATARPDSGTAALSGEITLSQGFLHEEQLWLEPGADLTEGLLGTNGTIEVIEGASHQGKGTAEFMLEVVPLGGRAQPLATIRAEGTTVAVDWVVEPAHRNAEVSRLVLKRTSGDKDVAVTIAVALRHSRTI